MWENLSEARLMHHLLTGAIPRPSEKALLDPELERIIRKATAAAPDQRYGTALELHRDLVAYLARAHAFCSMREVGAARPRGPIS
jgi:serine/threonine-protein kinase